MRFIDWLARLDWLGFLDQFWPNLAATFAGVLIALWVDRWRGRRKKRAERGVVLMAFRQAVDANLEVLGEISKKLIPTRVIFFPLDLGLFDAQSDKALDVMDDLPLLQRVNAFRYQLEHLARKLDTHIQHAYSATPDRQNWNDLRTQLANEIVSHATALVPKGHKLIEELDERLGTRMQPARA